MMKIKIFCFLYVLFAISALGQNQFSIHSDQWSATDGLGRKVPVYGEAGHQKNKFVGLFYWTWHTDAIANFELLDFTKVLKNNPEAISDVNHPAWNNLFTGWWEEPLFGYYRTTDEWILLKHAEMLADAGIDVVFFDCTNGNFTWKSSYTTLLKVWAQARKDGVKTPQIAFLLPFAATDGSLEAISELYTDLYEPELYKDLWFMWNNKPLIMAYPELVAKQGSAAAMKFNAASFFSAINITCPSWGDNIGSIRITLYKWDTNYNQSIAGTPIATKTFINFNDNSKLVLQFPQQQSGDYIWVLDNGIQTVGVWKWSDGTNSTVSYFNGSVVTGNYQSEISYTANNFTPLTRGTQQTPIQIQGTGISQQRVDQIKNFFAFRPGQGDMIYGPGRSDHWGWLETKQHGYAPKPAGGVEQATAGVAQNAWDGSNGQASAFNRPETYGRSYTKEFGQDTSPYAYLKGLNFQEQWNKAVTLDPDLIFVTGWNEWIAGRSLDWDVKPMSFVDEFSAEKSRDIEPVKSWGSNADSYYMQLVANVRKFKGMLPKDSVSDMKTIDMASPNSWVGVKPEFGSYKGNTLHRSHPGQGSKLYYTNTTGRNDIVSAKVARDESYIYFYVETADMLSDKNDPKWMRLFIDIDRNKATGWEGYDFIINRTSPTDSALVETSQNSWNWSKAGFAAYTVNEKTLVLKIKRSVLGLNNSDFDIEFKWSDNMQEDGNIMDFYVNGDVAPGGRFNYNYCTKNIINVPQTAYKLNSIPGTIEFEDFDNGGAGVAYADATFGNSGGAYRTNESVDIIEKSTGNYCLNAVNKGEWLKYTVDIKSIGKFAAEIQYASNDTAQAILYVDDIDKSGIIRLPASGGLTSWTTKTVDLWLTAGKHTLKFFVNNVANNLNLDNLVFVEKDVVFPGTGTGLNKSIWTATAGGRTWFNDSICSEIDAEINENWADVSPGCTVGKDFWNIRWQGQIEPLFTETYTFYLTVNDMGRLWINNQLVVDGWYATSSGTTITGTAALTAGQKVPIKVDFAEKLGSAYIKLEWSSASNPREVIPQSQFFPVTIPNAIRNLFSADFKISPNPATDKLSIQSGKQKVENIKIIDLQGRAVYQDNEDFVGRKTININLEKGIYIIGFSGDKTYSTQKLIIK